MEIWKPGAQDMKTTRESDHDRQACVSILFAGYLLMQVPSNLILNKPGKPSIYLPACMVVWSVISCCTAATTDYAGLLVVRLSLGFSEAAHFPGCLYLLSARYTRKELVKQTELLYSGSLLSGAFSGSMSAGIINGRNGARGIAAWRWLFIIEGSGLRCRDMPVPSLIVQEVGDMGHIQYARVRDIIGPNATFVDQSCTFPRHFNDFLDEDSKEGADRETDIFEQALSKEFGLKVTPESIRMLRILGGLGTHDLSAMREIIGIPKAVLGAFLKLPAICSVLFNYQNFLVTYESGLSGVPQFDAHIEVYPQTKIARVDFDTPYIKGLPVAMTMREKVCDGGFQERKIRKTYEDPYTLELLEFHDCIVNRRTPKSGAEDASKDVELVKMIMTAGFAN
ncbi:major facilitator superfamily domain-containing protein [Aspergillus pseudocaelatus]|uniref:Major facilitator superfamily domain-containing protein n=1 Tax=Aspergillus pseudocaelatus TaxID=1825620 RepID=A0ABQ6X0A5_9EURO|nr:major facilitator superfamily domain-containing protein [Aspergillus pseudocaelatus]